MLDRHDFREIDRTVRLAALCQQVSWALQTLIVKRKLKPEDKQSLASGIALLEKVIQASNAKGPVERTQAAFSGAVQELWFFQDAAEDHFELTLEKLAHYLSILKQVHSGGATSQKALEDAKQVFLKINVIALDRFERTRKTPLSPKLVEETA